MFAFRHVQYINGSRMRRIIGVTASIGMLLTFALSQGALVEPAAAVTRADLAQSQARQRTLKQQLAGVNAELAQKIIDLDDLTSNQIPAAQEALDAANDAAESAQQAAQAAAERLDAAQKDKADLEQKIKETGEDYDDAHAAVAQLARESFHSSDTATMMSVVTGASDTEDFIASMQSEAAVTRTETNAASEAAAEQNLQLNRKDRLEAIEQQIADLKSQAEAEAQSAKQAAAEAQSKKDELDALRAQSEQQRQELESQKSSLTTQEAKEAAAIVEMQAEIDSWNSLNLGGTATPSTGGAQQVGSGGGSSSSSGGGSSSSSSGGSSSSSGGGSSSSSGGASGMDYAVPGNCAEGSSYCYGHSTGNTVGGSAYPARQCTLWAYLRRSALGLPVGSYMGNGADWANTARSLGYLVNHTPHVGAVMVFRRGQYVNGWYANSQYGHVAVVERVNADGSVLISEGGTGFATFPAYETVRNAGNYEYIHY